MYTQKQYPVQPSTLAAQSLTSAADVQTLSFFGKLRVSRIMAKIQAAVVSTGNVVVQFVLRPTTGSSSGEVLLGTLTIPAGAAPGQTYYKDLSSSLQAVLSGQEVIARVSTAAAGGSAAGTALCQVEVEESPDKASNQGNLIASS